jgi:broad specificity phosphatase PhoE
MPSVGEQTRTLVEHAFATGAPHVAVLMRHSAREFEPGRHDLLNPLTDEGRALAESFGRQLPKQVLARGYASPAERCMETAALMLRGHEVHGGRVTRHRPVEGLGVFYVLDQMRMFKAMTSANGQVPFLRRWFQGDVPVDVMMPAAVAARIVGRVVGDKVRQSVATPQLDVCVSHDMTLYLVREMLLGIAAESAPVDFLDGVVVFERDGRLVMAQVPGREVDIEVDIDG